MISIGLKIVLTTIFLSSATPILSQSTKVYEYWLEKFLLPSLKQKFNDHKIIDDIDRHLKTKLASVAKIKKILSEDEQAEFSEPKKYFNKKLISDKSSLGKKMQRACIPFWIILRVFTK